MNKFLDLYPTSAYANEAKEILINLLANTNNYADALTLYESFGKPTAYDAKIYPKILFGRATEYINDQKLNEADDLLIKIIAIPMPAMYCHLLISGKAKLRTGLDVMMMPLSI